MNEHCGWSSGELSVWIVFHWTDTLSLFSTTHHNQHSQWLTVHNSSLTISVLSTNPFSMFLMSSEGCCSWYHAPHSVTLCYYHKNRQNSAACRCVSETAGSRAELGQNSLLLAERVMGRDTLTHIFIRAVGCRLVFRYLIIIIMLSHRVSRVGAPVLQTTAQVIWLIKEVKHRLNLSLCRTVVIQRHLTYKQTDHPQGIYQQTTHRHGTRHLQTDRPPTEHHTWFTSPTNRPQLHCTSMCQCRVLGHRDHIT